MDFNKMTEMDLLELRKQVNDQLESYKDRDKTKVFTVFIAFIGIKYFIKKENAIQYLKDCIEEDMLFDGNEAKCHEKYLTQSEVENYCSDFGR